MLSIPTYVYFWQFIRNISKNRIKNKIFNDLLCEHSPREMLLASARQRSYLIRDLAQLGGQQDGCGSVLGNALQRYLDGMVSVWDALINLQQPRSSL